MHHEGDPPGHDGKESHRGTYQRQRRAACAHLWSSELIELADDSSGDYIETEDGRRIFNGENVQRSKLRYEARRWVCSKLIRAYSDTNIEVTAKTAARSRSRPMSTGWSWRAGYSHATPMRRDTLRDDFRAALYPNGGLFKVGIGLSPRFVRLHILLSLV